MAQVYHFRSTGTTRVKSFKDISKNWHQMDFKSVGDIATALGMSDQRIRDWTDMPQFEAFLSDYAKRVGEAEGETNRRYTAQDLLVLNTIRTQKSNDNTWDDVAKLLTDGFRDSNLPARSALVMATTQAEAFELLSTAKERINQLESQLEDLKAQLEAKERQLEAQHKAHVEDIKSLSTDEIGNLREKIGELKFILKLNKIDPDTGRPSD